MTALFLALVLQGSDVVVGVQIQTKDGNSVNGTTDVASVQFESSLGKNTVQLKDISRIQLNGEEAVLSTFDGTSLKGKISQSTWKVKTALGEFTLKNADITLITIRGVMAAPRPAPAPSPAPAPAPGAVPGQAPGVPKVEKPAGLVPDKTLKITAAVTRALPSADGKKIFVLNASDSKVLVVDLAKLETEKEIALAGGETVFSIAPSGNVIMAGGKRTITAASIATGKVTKTFSIEMDVVDVCAIDDTTLLASASSNLLVISIPKQAVVNRINAAGGRLYPARGGKKIHMPGGAILLPDKAVGRDELAYAPTRGGSGYDLSISPDGRFGVSPHGQVYRLGKSFAADMVDLGKVEVHWGAAWAPSRKRLFLVTSLGFVKEYDTDSWELARSWFLGYQLSDVFFDEAGGFLVGVGGTVPANQGSSERPRYSNQAPQAGDLHRFELPK
jgi:hypothetical protein